MVEIKVDREKCTACGACVDICPMGVYEIQEVEGQSIAVPVNIDSCVICRACVVSCPNKAVSLE